MKRALRALGRFLVIAALSFPLFSSKPNRQDVLDRFITIDLNQVAFADALNQIGLQAGVKFVYTFTPDPDRMKVTLHARHKKLREVLTQFLQPYNLGYEVIGNKIILKPATITAETPPSQDEVHGQVTDAGSAQPLPNVTVRLKNGNAGVVTDPDGHYTITAPAGATLIFTFIGYEAKELKVHGPQLNTALEADTRDLGEVIVTALGIKKERKVLGYSVTEIDGNTLTEARENNVMNALEGRIAGVNVAGVATGPGASANVMIRGISSMTGSSQPLYVVDGIPITNVSYSQPDADGYGGSDGGDGINNINPDDIESISILKGAAAAALYGYRGSRGVVLITTKSGHKDGSPGIDFNSSYVVERVIDNTRWQHTYGQGFGGERPNDQASALSSGLSSWGAKLDGKLTPQFDGVARPYSAQTHNIHNFYKDGGAATNTIAFSKGFSNKGSVRFSVSDLRDNSMIPNAGLKRQSFHLSTRYNPAPHLSVDLKASYIAQQVQNTPNISDAPANLNFATLFLPPNVNIRSLAPGYTPDGNELRFSEDEYTTNPYFAAYSFSHQINRNRFLGIATLKYTFDNGLFLQARGGEDYFTDRGINITPNGTAYLPDGSMADNTYRSSELNLDGLAGKEFTLKKGLTLNAGIGGNYRKSIVENIVIQGSDFAVPYLYTISNLQNTQPSYSKPVVENRSVYATADFAYRNLLYLNLTGRNDWYSTLAPGKITYFYPSINTSFVFSELLHSHIIDYGKLRAGYAAVGGEADEAYQNTLNYNIVTSLNGRPVGNIVNVYVPNSALRPSSVKELEAGVNMGFLKSHLKADIAVYHKEITNSIIPATTSETSGYTGAYLNLGNLRNNGIEWLLSGIPVQTKTFSWTLTLNGAYNSNKVLRLAKDEDNLLLARSRAGEDDGENAYIAQVAGKPAAQIMALDPQRDAHGKLVLDPSTGAPDPEKAVYKAFGSGIDPWNAGLTNDFTYKNFSLSFLIDGKFGGKIFSGSNYYAYQMGLSKATLAGRDKMYGDGVNTPQLTPEDYYALLSVINSQFVYNAGFIKLRQLLFGYRFPKQRISVNIVMRNILTLMKHTPNIDPESNYTNTPGQGLELAGVPSFRSFGINLNIKL